MASNKGSEPKPAFENQMKVYLRLSGRFWLVTDERGFSLSQGEKLNSADKVIALCNRMKFSVQNKSAIADLFAKELLY